MKDCLMDLDKCARRALRGERTNPFPGYRYFLTATRNDASEHYHFPFFFDSPEEAVLMLIRTSPLMSEGYTFDVSIEHDPKTSAVLE
jgi:hypothetical protein